MDVQRVAIALALALVKAKRARLQASSRASDDEPPAGCSSCTELQERLKAAQDELSFLKSSVRLSPESTASEWHRSDVWDFFVEGDKLRRILENGSDLDSRQQAFEKVMEQCLKCIGYISKDSWEPNILFDACVAFLVGSIKNEPYAAFKPLLIQNMKTLLVTLFQTISTFNYAKGSEPRRRDCAARAIVALSENNVEILPSTIDPIFQALATFVAQVNTEKQVMSYQALDNLFFYCWILERLMVNVDGHEGLFGEVVKKIEELIAMADQSRKHLAMLWHYLCKILLSLPKPNDKSTSALCTLLSNLEKNPSQINV